MENNLNQLYNWSNELKKTEMMPALFIGHGSPMNGIEDNQFPNCSA
jgi:4,5-DOPA dioxygenase extradiol